jgi:hypothetical protein
VPAVTPFSPGSRATATRSPAGGFAASAYPDSVGIGSYRIDLHPTSAGDNYIDARLPRAS